MSTTTLVRPAVAGRPQTATRRPAHSVGTAEVPRTSVAQPWDRVRFAGPTSPPTAADADPADAEVDADTLPDPAQWAGALVRSAVEALRGIRPAAQLARWLSAELYDSLARRAGLAVRVLGRPTVAHRAMIRRVHVCRLGPGTVEAAVVVHDGQHMRAAAVRLEVHRGRWRATALEIG
ncbi:Rv3235 family protein [Georgenia subflava]|uniref:Energy transducer TonB n=1 Tax=Georgenia subflava TaxID=1622177 RepID=A0A6N7EPF1_9MICO|nr:Rv3235 family protein [Georgenia subflava]MPV38747.1 energy transducer TonB [Georgenia subflava]